MVLGDGMLGQMMEPVDLKRRPARRKLPEKDWALTGAQGRPQRIVRSLWLGDRVLENLNLKLQKIYHIIEQNEVLCEDKYTEDADIVLVAYGMAARIVRSAVDKARAKGIRAGWVRPQTLWPFPSGKINVLADKPRIFLVVEMSMGQMVEDVKLAVQGRCPVLFYGRAGGGIPQVEQVLEYIEMLIAPGKTEPTAVQK
jgi:2-oxoglutarate ferredoxin oxidoreductase subunit alpha